MSDTFECAWCRGFHLDGLDDDEGEDPAEYTYPAEELGGYDQDGQMICEGCVDGAEEEPREQREEDND